MSGRWWIIALFLVVCVKSEISEITSKESNINTKSLILNSITTINILNNNTTHKLKQNSTINKLNTSKETKTVTKIVISSANNQSSFETNNSENDNLNTTTVYKNPLKTTSNHTKITINYDTPTIKADTQNNNTIFAMLSYENDNLRVSRATSVVNNTNIQVRWATSVVNNTTDLNTSLQVNRATSVANNTNVQVNRALSVVNNTNIQVSHATSVVINKTDNKNIFLTPRTVTQSLTNNEFIYTTEWYKSSAKEDDLEEHRTVNIETPNILESITENYEKSWITDNHVVVTNHDNFEEAQIKSTTFGYDETKAMEAESNVGLSDNARKYLSTMYRRQMSPPATRTSIMDIGAADPNKHYFLSTPGPPDHGGTWKTFRPGGPLDTMPTHQMVIVAVRTTPFRLSFEEDCDYLAYYCLKAYDTGKLCARTLYYTYHDFPNYCMLDYVNCMERFEVWQVVHMGACFQIEPLQEYKHYPYENDYFLDQYYMLEDLV